MSSHWVQPWSNQFILINSVLYVIPLGLTMVKTIPALNVIPLGSTMVKTIHLHQNSCEYHPTGFDHCQNNSFSSTQFYMSSHWVQPWSKQFQLWMPSHLVRPWSKQFILIKTVLNVIPLGLTMVKRIHSHQCSFECHPTGFDHGKDNSFSSTQF